MSIGRWLPGKFGIDDGWPVMCEPFKQWVIEDHFPLGRPAWEKVGAQMTSDVLPYEKMKLRLLNASHQAMCYIGMLLGYQFAHEAMGDAQISKLVESMMEIEVTPLVPVVPGRRPGRVQEDLDRAVCQSHHQRPAFAHRDGRFGQNSEICSAFRC